MDHKCCICGANISELSEIDQLGHVDKCLDAELEKKTEEIEKIETQKYEKPVLSIRDPEKVYDLSGMPDYENMPASELKNHLNEYGMKKTIETKQARVILKETWLYVNHGVFPSFLNKYV